MFSIVRIRFPPSSSDVIVSLHQSRTPGSIALILFWIRYRTLTLVREGRLGMCRMLLKDRSRELGLASYRRAQSWNCHEGAEGRCQGEEQGDERESRNVGEGS